MRMGNLKRGCNLEDEDSRDEARQRVRTGVSRKAVREAPTRPPVQRCHSRAGKDSERRDRSSMLMLLLLLLALLARLLILLH